MANLTTARKTVRLPDQEDGIVRFSATVDQQWSVYGNPHGGYLLSIIVGALSSLQQSTPHPHPAHLMTSYLQGAKPGPVEVHIKVLRVGKSWTNLEARLIQFNEAIIISQSLFTLFPPHPTGQPVPFDTNNQNLHPLTPSPYSRQSPFVTHPSQCDLDDKTDEPFRRWSKNSVFWFMDDHMKWAEDPGVKKRRQGTGKEGEKLELEWGGWCEFTDDVVDAGSLPFWADIFSSIPEIFPPPHRVEPHYYPTLAFSIQFHAALPFPSDTPYLVAPRTVGCYSTGNIISEGRHEQRCEVWTAPSAIGVGGDVPEDWRARSFPLLTSTQLALSVPTAKLVKKAKAKI